MSKNRKIIRILLAVFLVAITVGTAWNWRNIQMVATYNPIFFPTWYSEPETEAEARLQDLDHLRKLTGIDRSFSDKAAADFTKLIDEAEAKVETLTDAEFYLFVSKAVALADNGHSNISDQPLHRQFNTIGAKLFWFADGLFIVRADEEHGDLLGGRVLRIEGNEVESVAKTLGQYRGGPDSWRRLAMPMMIESPEIMHAAGLAKSPDALKLSLENSDGKTVEVSLKGTRADHASALPFRRPWMSLKPEALPGENEIWKLALENSWEELASYLTDTDAPLYKPMKSNGYYIRTMTGFGTETQSVSEFLDEALASVADGSLDYLAVDFRWNAGGDYLQAIDFAKQAPAKVKDGGKLYIIVGPQTFSSAVVTSAMLKYYGGDKAIIIGTKMGDRGQFWAERGMGFKLPNSKFPINYATGYHDWEKGCTGQEYCFTFNLEHEVPAGSLKPSKVIDPAYADYASGKDVVMDWIESRHRNVN